MIFEYSRRTKKYNWFIISTCVCAFEFKNYHTKNNSLSLKREAKLTAENLISNFEFRISNLIFLKGKILYDIIIIGAGPAGLTAAIYARRAEKRVLIIEKETFGGQMTASPKIENYPGFLEVSGNELADRLIEQVFTQGGEIELDTVTAIEGEGGELYRKGCVKGLSGKGGYYRRGLSPQKTWS